jgi:hypothetical protein
MPSPDDNLLLRLHKWAWRQDENFMTEALAHLIQHLLEREPEAGVSFLASLTKDFFTLRAEEARTVIVRTQVFSADGTPDLDLRSVQERVILEVKVESPVRTDQLRRYRKLLDESRWVRTQLVLLTRYPEALSPEIPVRHIRWFQLARWLEEERSRYAFEPVSAYLVDQFLGFLGARNMTIEQVTWEMSGGIRALRALSSMLSETASDLGHSPQLHGDRDYMGVYLDRRAYWLGIKYDNPTVLEFSTHRRKVDPQVAERLGIEGIVERDDKQGHAWIRSLNLEAEEIHFFARSKVSQRQFLEKFLRDCLETVKEIEIAGSDATSPEEPEAIH